MFMIIWSLEFKLILNDFFALEYINNCVLDYCVLCTCVVVPLAFCPCFNSCVLMCLFTSILVYIFTYKLSFVYSCFSIHMNSLQWYFGHIQWYLE